MPRLFTLLAFALLASSLLALYTKKDDVELLNAKNFDGA